MYTLLEFSQVYPRNIWKFPLFLLIFNAIFPLDLLQAQHLFPWVLKANGITRTVLPEGIMIVV